MNVKEARELLEAEFKKDPGFAWSWHCNVACCVMDEGVNHVTANRAAARFMKLAFGVDTSRPWGECDKTHCLNCGAELLDVVALTAKLGGPQVCGPCIDRRYAGR